MTGLTSDVASRVVGLLLFWRYRRAVVEDAIVTVQERTATVWPGYDDLLSFVLLSVRSLGLFSHFTLRLELSFILLLHLCHVPNFAEEISQ